MANIDEINENDPRYTMIHYLWNGSDNWYKTDQRGNVIHHIDSKGLEEWKEYNENNQIIHYKNSDGCEAWYEYDEKGNCISRRTNEDKE